MLPYSLPVILANLLTNMGILELIVRMAIQNRQVELSVMESVGMTDRQVYRVVGTHPIVIFHKVTMLYRFSFYV